LNGLKVFKVTGIGRQKYSIQFGRDVFLNVFSILKFLLFEDSFHNMKEKMQSRKLGLSSQIWMKLWHDASLPCLC
jgi:hypothetical protein